MTKRKISVVTGTRAEYGLLYWVIKEILEDPDLELQLIVTGMHLSKEFGFTINEIEKDGIPICKKIETLLSSDTPVGISKSMGLGMISFAEVFSELCPDICLVLGDRFEIFSVVSAALIANIPVAHCHGGESTEGLIDESLRHSITKMSHLHFTSTDEYRNRVIQLGEQPNRVFNTGALGVETLYREKLMEKGELEKSLNFKLNKPSILVTYHPVTLETDSSERHFRSLLKALDDFPDSRVIFTMPNADTDGRVISQLISEYVNQNQEKSIIINSLGRLRYLSALKHIDIVIGNSSSGLIEAPSFNIPTINIGDRQKGRLSGPTVMHTKTSTNEIRKSIKRALNQDYINSIKDEKNPYDNGMISKNIIEILKTYPLKNILKKNFYNLEKK